MSTVSARAARTVAAEVTDPELPMLTLEDLGVLREVSEANGSVTVTITPTYSGCPAMDTMRDDLVRVLHDAGYQQVDVRTALYPPWSSDWISAEGSRKLAEAGISPPGQAPSRGTGPIPLSLGAPVHRVTCPRCGSHETEQTSRFSATACKSLYRCGSCAEPFEHFKEL